MRRALLSLLILACGCQSGTLAERDVVGTYHAQGIDSGLALELRPDHSFVLFATGYRAEFVPPFGGAWTLIGRGLVLTWDDRLPAIGKADGSLMEIGGSGAGTWIPWDNQRLLRQTPPWKPFRGDELLALKYNARTARIDMSDGISKLEAYKLGLPYLREQAGYVGVPEDEGAAWKLAVFEGWEGVHARDLYIGKRTAEVRVVERPPAAR